MVGRLLLLVAGIFSLCSAHAEGLTAFRLGILYNLDDHDSRDVAVYYAKRRGVPDENMIGVHMPAVQVMTPESFTPLRNQVLDRLPSAVESLLLVWTKPWAVGCMSVTTAFAAGYRADFCPSGCAKTAVNPLFDSSGWLPADTVGWWPSMLLPSADPALAKALIERGVAAQPVDSPGTLYLIDTTDADRNVRAGKFGAVVDTLSPRIPVVRLKTPVTREVPDAIGYFTGVTQVEEMAHLHFRPGAIADHLTSTGGILQGGQQMSALAWIQQGATASYGSVSEPCNFLEKFPDVGVLFRHYSHGETALESYWKSVAMPGQGLFIGEPLARPFSKNHP